MLTAKTRLDRPIRGSWKAMKIKADAILARDRLAMVCAAKVYPLVVTMAETFSVGRRKLMRFLGARVVITPAAARASGMVNKTVELAEKHG
jgi:hypothetical protein